MCLHCLIDWCVVLILCIRCRFPQGVPWVRYHGTYKDLNINVIWPGKDPTLGKDASFFYITSKFQNTSQNVVDSFHIFTRIRRSCSVSLFLIRFMVYCLFERNVIIGTWDSQVENS